METPTTSPDSALAQRADDELVLAMASGDRRAIDVLYQRYASLMLAVGLRVLGDRGEAEDLLHDVFLEAWRSASSFDRSRGTVKTWLLMRVRSRAIDRKRSVRVVRAVEVDDVNTLADHAVAPEDSGPDRAKVRAALASLPDTQRTVLTLSYFEGLSSSEIARKLDVPIGTVKSRVAAARRQLYSIFTDSGGAGAEGGPST